MLTGLFKLLFLALRIVIVASVYPLKFPQGSLDTDQWRDFWLFVLL